MARATLTLLFAVLLSSVDARAGDRHIQIVEFTASVCEPCKRMQPIIAKLSQEGWGIRQFDVAAEAQLVQHFQVKSVPTIVIIRDGQEVDRVVGALGYEKLLVRFQRASGSQPSSTGPSDLALVPPQHQWRSSAESATAASRAPATVRGQSPAITAFPVLSAGTFGSMTSAPALQSGPMSAELPTDRPVGRPANLAGQTANLPPGTREMTEAPATASLESFGGPPPEARRARQSPSAEAIARASAATVRIRIDEANAVSFGTGTIISVHGQEALVLTCGHLFRDIKPDAQLSVDVFQAGRPISVPATLVTFNAKEYDLGLIEFRLPFAIAPVPVAPVAEHPQVGEVAFSFGCDRGADPTRRDTQIKRINRYLGAANVEIHGAPVVGRSGGGLFDSQGRLVGVCNAADEEDNEGIYAALPIVHEHIAHLNLPELDPAAARSLASAQPQPSPTAGFAQLASATTQPAPTTPAGAMALLASAPAASAPWASSSTASLAGQSVGAAAPGYWPDQNQVENRLASPGQAAQVRCIIRDPSGQESTLTIDHASEELLAALRQHARR